MKTARKFLTAEWRHVLMVNYSVDPAVLRSRVPAGTEIDSWKGAVYASLVGFNFLNTRVKGMAIPFHSDFEEINLRFYVRRKDSTGWKRGVVFVKEIVPKPAIAGVARLFYNEPYVSLPTRHTIKTHQKLLVRYEWKHRRRWNLIEATAQGDPRPLVEGSEEQFISEHYWGYSVQRDLGTKEYEVEHPSWQIWTASNANVDVDVGELYGDEFIESLAEEPASVFIADGSEVTVSAGKRL